MDSGFTNSADSDAMERENNFYREESYGRRIEELEAKIKQLQNTSSNSDYAKLPTIEECYQAIPFPSDERECAMFVAGIAECHKFVGRYFA